VKTSKTGSKGSRRIGLAVVGLAMAVLAGASAPAATPAAVGIKDFRFTPPTLTVPVGTTVTWTNHDEEPHTITSATGAFSSTGLSHDETFTQRFTQPGTYAYFCALHPHMKATVIVR
jgi:plastocyanin